MNQKAFILILIFLAGIFTVYFLAGSKEDAKTKAVVGIDAPQFELKDLDNRNWRLSDLRGKVVLLNFWASWCETCKGVNSSMQSLINEDKDSGIVYISILYKDDPSRAKDYMKKNGFDFPVLIDDKNLARIYGIGGVPETFIINKKGVIKKKVAGPIKWDSPAVKTAIRQLTAE